MADALIDLREAAASFKRGDFARAAELAARVLTVDPGNPDALNIAGSCALNAGRHDEAITLLEQAVQLKPHYWRARNHLANLHLERGHLADAEHHARLAIETNPQSATAHHTLARILAPSARWPEAIAALERAAQLDAVNPDIWYDAGVAQDSLGRPDLAAMCFSRAIGLRPDHTRSYLALSAIHLQAGQLPELIATLRAGCAASPQDSHLHSRLLFALMFDPDIDAQSLFAEHLAWAKTHATPLSDPSAFHRNEPNRARPLRVGYISPNFREHSIAFFFEPILEHHDRRQFELYLYSDVKSPDDVTRRMHRLGDTWRDTIMLDDAALAALVRQDQIDILVDLNQHLDGSRLLAFARKPAPVQVAYLGYPGTTGLAAMDYRLSDPYLDTAPACERWSTEQIARLPQTYFCYRPPQNSPDIVDPPATRNDHPGVTFVSHHGLLKLNHRCITTWARILSGTPGSRLIIKAFGLSAEFARERYRSMFASIGVDVQRVLFRDYSSLYQAMLELNDADIALDAFPYSGATTACHTLWMGVPFVSLAGTLPFQRMGLSVLAQLGLNELVAADEDEYVHVAVALANDLPRLCHYRRTLRQRMQDSPLMNAQRFTRDLEEQYRTMWQRWASGASGSATAGEAPRQ